MYIEEELLWDHQIDTLVKKISSKHDILRYLRTIVPVERPKPMYNASILNTLIMMMLCMMQPLRPGNLGYTDSKHEQLS